MNESQDNRVGDETGPIDEIMRQWLDSEETVRFLKKTAAMILVDARRQKLSPDLIGLDTHLKDLVALEEIFSVLTEFLLTNETLQSLLCTKDDMNRSRYIMVSFLNHWKSRALGTGGDPWRKFRKHVFDKLRKSDTVFTRAAPPPARYSVDADSREIQSLPKEIRDGIGPPPEVGRLTREEAVKRETILKLAVYFWHRVCELENHPVWIDINDLVDWIFAHFSMGTPDEAPFGSSEDVADNRYRPDAPPVDETLLHAWADRFSHRLSPDQQTVLFLLRCLGATLKEAAERLHVKSPETVRKRLERGEALLKGFCRELPWLSDDDFDRRAAELFIEILCEILEKSVSTPST